MQSIAHVLSSHLRATLLEGYRLKSMEGVLCQMASVTSSRLADVSDALSFDDFYNIKCTWLVPSIQVESGATISVKHKNEICQLTAIGDSILYLISESALLMQEKEETGL